MEIYYVGEKASNSKIIDIGSFGAFRYEIHTDCKDPKDYAGVGWCSLDSEYEGRWGYCSSNCPKDYDDPCKEIVCNIAGEKCVNGQCKCGSACSCEFNPAGQSCDPDKSICK